METFCIGVWLINSVAEVSGEQQGDSATYRHVSVCRFKTYPNNMFLHGFGLWTSSGPLCPYPPATGLGSQAAPPVPGSQLSLVSACCLPAVLQRSPSLDAVSRTPLTALSLPRISASAHWRSMSRVYFPRGKTCLRFRRQSLAWGIAWY